MSQELLTRDNIGDFQQDLLKWFERAKRYFPWRETNDPYAVLVAEKLLQQTLARETVVKTYQELIRRYPTPKHLAGAELAKLEAVIRPLGLVYRAKELKMMACELMERHNGTVPANLKGLLKLTGVGQYSARAVMSFAYGEDIAVVDTNVARFLYRLYEISGPMPANPARKKSLINLAEDLIPPGRAKDFNLAVLDLCAAICKSNNPQCVVCPVRDYCLYGSKRLE